MKKISESIIFIIFTYLLVNYLPIIKKYDIQIKFSIYRSIMCTFFVLRSLIYLLNNKNIFSNAFITQSNLLPLFFKFFSYIVIDIIFTISKKKRYDLLIHHVIILIAIVLAYKNNYVGTILPILLINEAISIVSGFDTVEILEKKFINSVKFKKIRKIIISTIRFPIWLVFIYLIKNAEFSKKLKLLLISLTLAILGLDFYWFSKCNKFIYRNSS